MLQNSVTYALSMVKSYVKMLSEMRWSMERNESLDCLKGIAIFLVMFGHVQVHNQMTDPYLYDVIKSLQMPLFFLISGYLAGTGTKIQSCEQYRERVRKRAVSYLLPFFSWLVVQHITFVPLAIKTVLFQLDYGLWFLPVLFLFTWMAYTAQLVQAMTKKKWTFRFVILGDGILILGAYLAGVTLLSPSLLIVYFPFYIGAYFYGLHSDIIQKKIPYKLQRTAAYGGGILLLIMAAALDLVTVTGMTMLAVQMLASLLGCMAVIRLVCDWKGTRIKSGLAFMGRYTLEIYVIHYQFDRVLNPHRMLYFLYAFAVMSMITVVLIWTINRIPLFRFLLFGK